MAITANQTIDKTSGWVEVATDPDAFSITANTPGVWYVAITESGTPTTDTYGERMGDYDSYMTGTVTGIIYVRVASTKGIKFGITKE